jgi:hypothetical protein
MCGLAGQVSARGFDPTPMRGLLVLALLAVSSGALK